MEAAYSQWVAAHNPARCLGYRRPFTIFLLSQAATLPHDIDGHLARVSFCPTKRPRMAPAQAVTM